MLWALASEVLDDGELLALAEPPAVHAVISRGWGASLCCGLSGQAYAALALCRATGNSVWVPHAERLAEEAGREPVGTHLPQHSFWGGDVGVALLSLEIADPSRAAMPVFDTLR